MSGPVIQLDQFTSLLTEAEAEVYMLLLNSRRRGLTRATLADLRIGMAVIYQLMNLGLVIEEYVNLFGTGGLSLHDADCGNFTFRYVATPPGQNFVFRDIPGAGEFARSNPFLKLPTNPPRRPLQTKPATR
jgi:hypothetical protein